MNTRPKNPERFKVPCSFEGCRNVTGGYKDHCLAHYRQLKNTGVLKPLQNKKAWTLEAIKEKVTVEDGCWRWRPKDGYAKGWHNGAHWTMHRLTYHLQTANNVEGIFLHHKCAHQWCINPNHVEPATDYDNNLEMMARKSYEARIQQLETRVADLEKENAELRASGY